MVSHQNLCLIEAARNSSEAEGEAQLLLDCIYSNIVRFFVHRPIKKTTLITLCLLTTVIFLLTLGILSLNTVMELSMPVFLSLLTALFLFTSQSSVADPIYRWTDTNGQVHFGSHPPAQDKPAEEVKLRVQQPSSSSATSTNTETSATSSNATAESEPATEEPKVDPVVAERNCRIALDQKQTLSENFNRRYKQPDGTVRPLDDAERAARIKQMDEAIKQYCK